MTCEEFFAIGLIVESKAEQVRDHDSSYFLVQASGILLDSYNLEWTARKASRGNSFGLPTSLIGGCSFVRDSLVGTYSWCDDLFVAQKTRASGSSLYPCFVVPLYMYRDLISKEEEISPPYRELDKPSVLVVVDLKMMAY